MSIVGVCLIVLDAKKDLNRATDVFDELCCRHKSQLVALLHELCICQFLDLKRVIVVKCGLILTSAGDLTLTSR